MYFKINQIILFLLVLLFWLQYVLWFGKNGVYDFLHIKNDHKIRDCNQLIVDLKVCNNRLLSEIHALASGQEEVIEERARHELGMIKSGEIFYYLMLTDENIHK